MAAKLIDDLNTEWSRIVTRRSTTRTFRQWQHDEPAVEQFRSISDLVEAAHDPERTCPDAVIAALLRVGADDDLAWRAVLQIVIPGIARVIRRLAPGEHRLDDVAATVITAAWGRIAEYPLERRPTNIVANIVIDTRQSASRALYPKRVIEIPTLELGQRYASNDGSASPVDVLVRLIERAVRNQIVTADQARIVVLSRVHGVPCNELAAERGVLPHSLRRRRLRIEAALIAAAA